MLREIRVKNFAIIDELALSFSPGLTALTGETGAGKSIIAGSLGLALGGRANAEMIKSGQTEAVIEAFFEIRNHPVLEELGIDSTDGIIIRRVISTSGKSRAYVNGSMVTVQALSALGETLVDFHSQHEHQSLLSPETQLQIVDAFGGLGTQKEAFQAIYSEAHELSRRIETLRQGVRERERRIDLLKFQVSEITSSGPVAGEDRELDEERAILANMGRLRELAETAYESLYSADGSGLERVGAAVSAVREIAGIDPHANGISKGMEEAVAILEDAAHEVRSIRDRYQPDPERLDRVEERLDAIRTLKKKYGETIDEILRFRDEAQAELELLEHAEESAAELEEELKAKEIALREAADKLTKGRKKAASRIEKAIHPILEGLALEHARLNVQIRDVAPSPTGADAVELYFSANAGEPPKPLHKVASGGELSRIMLALKCVLREASGVPVLVFDEVDAGIGGATAISVAERLHELSLSHQVICITHLAQIASMADAHYLIEKAATDSAVCVNVNELTGRARQEEIARMLGGTVTAASLSHAKEIIRKDR